MRRVFEAALLVALLAGAPAAAADGPDPPDPGKTTSGTVVSNGTEYPYLLHTPTTYVPGSPAPLVVMVHGCQTTAEQEMRLTLFNRVAEREGFVVLYPEVDATGQELPGPLNHCWKFFDPSAYFRGNSDPAAIAEMTRSVMHERAIDGERVYLVGVSAGGLMAAVGAAAYSDLYAAVGLVASAGYADGTCFTSGVGNPVEGNAQLAYEQMGPRARVVPVMAVGSDADLAFPASCTDKALEQGLRTNNLVLSGAQEGPIALTPATVEEEQVPDGHGYTVSRFRDPDGCLVGEKWIIHGMPHAWPGGTTDPEYDGFTDTRAPDGAEGTWEFLQRYRMSETGMPCAAAERCGARTVRFRLARGARVRKVAATVTGEAVRTRVRGRRVRLRLPSGPSGTVTVVLRVRRQGENSAQVRRRAFERCAG
jgi:poly(hydroxyalkanoate) depolymerase family esterase